MALVIAVAVVLIAIAGCAALLVGMGISKDVTTSFSSAIVGLLPYTHGRVKRLVESRQRVNQLESEAVVRLEGYGLSWLHLVGYGSLLMLGASFLASGLAAIIISLSEAAGDVGAVFGLIVLTVVVPAVFLVGRWIGRRSSNRGWLITIATAILARAMGTIFDALTADDAITAKLFEQSKVEMILNQITFGSLVFVAIALVGYWRGTKQRLPAYLDYLLHRVPAETRNTIVELAYEEAARATASALAPPAPVPYTPRGVRGP